MIKMNLNGKDVEIRFDYEFNMKNKPYFTICRVIIDKNIKYTSNAECSILDNPCKNKGRKLSLSRALHETTLTKEERRTIWYEYYRMRGGKW